MGMGEMMEWWASRISPVILGIFLLFCLEAAGVQRQHKTKFNGRWRHRMERPHQKRKPPAHKLCLSNKVMQQEFATYCSKQALLG